MRPSPEPALDGVPAPAWQARWAGWLLGIDLRSLALFRAGLALVWLADSLARFGDLSAFYTDQGVLPRGFAAAVEDSGRVSLHLASGDSRFMVAALLLQLLVGLALLVGWKARQAALCGWLLAASLANRNPAVLVDADLLIIALLFWAQFLPLSARWSADSALSSQPLPSAALPHRSWAALALKLQVLGVAAILIQTAGGPNSSLGDWQLGVAPGVLAVAATVWLGAGFWNLQSRRQTRRLAGARLRLYYDRDCGFCQRSCLLLRELLLLPNTEVLAAQEHPRARALLEANQSWVVIDYDDKAQLKWSAFTTLIRRSPVFGWLSPVLGLASLRPGGDRLYDRLARHRGRLARATRWMGSTPGSFAASSRAQFVAATVAALVLVWNLAVLGYLPAVILDGLGDPLRLLRLDQDWRASESLGEGGETWLVVPARRQDGSEVDLLSSRLSTPSFAGPESRSQSRGFRWQVYERYLLGVAGAGHRAQYARYLCERWNRVRDESDPSRLLELRLVQVIETDASAEQRVLWREDCSSTSGAKPQG